MTKVSEVKHDDKYTQYLDNGFVGLKDYMGSDEAIVRAARTSYGAGTKSKQTDRGLIRYLVRHEHWSPVEMNEVVFHLKIPIFVMRQLVRHRTAALNEESLRYSLPQFDFYVPKQENTSAQSTSNNQGRSSVTLSDKDFGMVEWLINTNNANTKELYEILNTPHNKTTEEFRFAAQYDAYNEESGLGVDFPGIARELSRMVLPVNLYTELYWKCDLRNLFNLLRLRLDPHAQFEIVELAKIMLVYVEELYPITTEAFRDYILNARKFSGMEMNLLKDLMVLPMPIANGLQFMMGLYHDEKQFLKSYDLTEREFVEFKNKMGSTLIVSTPPVSEKKNSILPISEEMYHIEDIDRELLIPTLDEIEKSIETHTGFKVSEELSDKLIFHIEDMIAKMLPNRDFKNYN